MALDEARRTHVSELQTRVASAIVLAPLALFAVLLGGIAFAALVTLVAVIAFWEWTTIGRVDAIQARLAAAVLLAAGLLTLQVFGGYLPALILILPAVAALAIGLRDRRFQWIGLGLVYVAVPCVGFILLRSPDGLVAIVFVLAVVWVTDIAAFFGGRAIGGAKLWPRVSPKKTWSGAISGLAAAVATGGLVAELSGAGGFLLGAVLALPLSIAAQAGDLFESAVKRHFGVKDSGSIIPGHGGVLDRVDGLFGAAALAWFIAAIGIGGNILTVSTTPGAGG